MLNFGQQQVGGENTAPATQAPVPTPLPAPATMTVNDLYTQVLGRAPDAGGLAYWQNAFGTGAVTPEQQANFMQAAQGELAQRSAADQQQLAPNLVNTTSPATQATTLAPVAPPPPTPPVMTVNDLYTQILGRAPDAGGLAYWQNAFGGDVDPTEQASFMQAAQAELARRPAADQQQLAPNLVNTSTTGATTGGIDTLLTNQTAATTAAADAAAKAKLGIFQKVYDPKNGREFVSPAQAFQWGVTDYVTEMPLKLEFLNDKNRTEVTDLMAGGLTFEQAIDKLGSKYGMSGKDFYNYQVQGGLRYNIGDAVRKNQSLTPDQLVAKLQAFKDKPPTTAQEKQAQNALYADYANRYANSSWNYANMGGKAQDFSLKPADYLRLEFTGYAEPINFALSNMNQRTPEYKEMAKILTANPEINDVIDQLYKLNPEQTIFNDINPKYSELNANSASGFNRSLIRLAGDIKSLGKYAAIQKFISQQQNLLSARPDAQGKVGNFNQVTMANPEYRALNAIKDSYTPNVSDSAWNERVEKQKPIRDRVFGDIYRDPTTGKGLTVEYNKNGNPQSLIFFNQQGNRVSSGMIQNPEQLLEAAYKSGIPMSAVAQFAETIGKDVIKPSGGSSYWPTGLASYTLNDLASGKIANTIASDDWFNFMAGDTQAKNPESADTAVAKVKNYQNMAKAYLADTSAAKAGASTTAANSIGIGSLINDSSKVVNDLYASIGRTGVGTETNRIDQEGFDYWKQMLDSGMTPEQVKEKFQGTVNEFLTNKKDDAYSQYVAPNYLKSVAVSALADATLEPWQKYNKIFESGQAYGMDDKKLDEVFGKNVADQYRTQYGAGIKDFINTSLAKDEGTTFGELATIKSSAKEYGLDPTEIAKYTGINRDSVNTLFDAYDKGLANIAKSWDTAKTTAGTDAKALSEAEVNKAKAMLALESQYKVTDEDFAKAMGMTVKDVKSYLEPIKDAPKTLESLTSNSTMSGADIRAKIEELKKNPAISGIYGAALEKFSEKADKDYSGSYGGKNYESLNPIAVSNVLSQLKAQQAAGTSQYYQGGAKEGKKGGFGSLDAMTEDMAKNLVAAGITDIRQVGEGPVYEPVQEIGKTYNGNRVYQTGADEYGNGGGSYYYRKPTDETDSEGNVVYQTVMVPKDAKLDNLYGFAQDSGDGGVLYNPIDPSKLTKDKDGKVVTQTGTTAVNKLTGEPLSKASNYAERTGGNSWSGTFAGKGNTGYNVQFKDGNPIFYTSGASSSDFAKLAPFLAIASFIPGAAPFVAGLNALYAADQGNWKGAILSGLGAAGPLAGMAGASADTVNNIASASKVANVVNAVANKDLLGTIMSGVSAASDSNMFGEGAFNPKANVLGNFSTKDLLGGVSMANALKTGDMSTLANIAAQMSGSKDAITAAKGLTLMNALKSDNPMAIASAVQKMNLTQDVIGKAGGGLASLPGLIKNGNKNTLADKTAFDGLNGSLVAKMLNQQPPEVREAMLRKIMQAA